MYGALLKENFMSEIIACMICKKQFNRVTGSHLKNHGITTKDYLIRYPDAKLFSDDLRYAYGKSARENNPMHNKATVEKVRAKLTGMPKSEEHKIKISKNRKGVSWGKHTEEHKEYISEISRKNRQQLLASGWKLPKWSDERKIEQSKKMKGNKIGKLANHNKGKSLNLSNEQRINRSNKRREFLSKNKETIRTSSFEDKYAAWCDSHNIIYEQQFVIDTSKGKWLYDFFLPEFNMLVELDGEYWHCTKKALARDKIKNRLAKKHGFTILRISDKNPDFSLTFINSEIILEHSESLLKHRQIILDGRDNP